VSKETGCSIKRLINEQTPYEFWFEFLDAMVREIRQRKAESKHDNDDFHNLVWLCTVTATHVVTGLRQQAGVHIREGLQYRVPDGPHDFRQIHTRVVDMKNKKNFQTGFRDRFFPWDVEVIWREHTREHFKRRGVEAGSLVELSKEEERRLRREGHRLDRAVHPETGVPLASHNFFLTDTDGVPYGCPEEDSDGKGRDARRLVNRTSQMGKRWKELAIAFVAEQMDYEVPVERSGFTLHNARNVIAQRLTDEEGIEAAANYLSDTIKTAEMGYTQKSTKSVDLAKHVRRPVPAEPVLTANSLPQNRLADAEAPDFAGYRGAVAGLRELLSAGDLTEDEFDALREDEKRRYGIKAAA
jgi:hypothetical protein